MASFVVTSISAMRINYRDTGNPDAAIPVGPDVVIVPSPLLDMMTISTWVVAGLTAAGPWPPGDVRGKPSHVRASHRFMPLRT